MRWHFILVLIQNSSKSTTLFGNYTPKIVLKYFWGNDNLNTYLKEFLCSGTVSEFKLNITWRLRNLQASSRFTGYAYLEVEDHRLWEALGLKQLCVLQLFIFSCFKLFYGYSSPLTHFMIMRERHCTTWDKTLGGC